MLEELVVYLRAAREAQASAWALVVTSSEALEKEVLGALVEHYGEVDIVDVSTGEDPRLVVEAMLASPTTGAARTSVVTGLSVVLASEHRDELLAWLNFHREDFERPARIFLFMLQDRYADPWQRLAPDLDRYTQHFDFVDWDDLVADAERAASKLDIIIAPSPSEAIRRAEQILSLSRGHDRQEIKALVDVGLLSLEAALIDRARETIEAALSRARAIETKEERSRARKRHDDSLRIAIGANAVLMSVLGHPSEALREIEGLEQDADDDLLRLRRSVIRFLAGSAHRAFLELEESSASNVGSQARLTQNIAVVGEWLGQARNALGRIRGASHDLISWMGGSPAGIWACFASLLVDTGDIFDALNPLTRSLRVARAAGLEMPRVTALTSLVRATLDVGRPVGCRELLQRANMLPGWKTAIVHGLAIVRAEVHWTLSGPTAVLPVVRTERERQRGWKAPIPAAELAYVRALASVQDDEARRRLQDAADRFRAMDGLNYLSEIERWIARLDRFDGAYDRATTRVQEGLEWHVREGLRPREARDRTEMAMIALGRGDAGEALESASRALDLIRICGTRLYEPAALVALAAAERALGHHDTADAHDRRWRRLVRGIGAKGLEAELERDAAWARNVAVR